MKKADMCTPEQFVKAWCCAWEDSKDKHACFIKKFQEKARPWTQCMLSDEGAFLERVAKRLNYNEASNDNDKGEKIYVKEHDRIDMVLMSDYNKGFPLFFDVVIEHENNAGGETGVKNEMWKLIFRRSPLKVIIFYTHNPEENLKEMRKMLKDANDFFPENKETNYLFIIGNLTGEQEKDYKICWQYWKCPSSKEISLKSMC